VRTLNTTSDTSTTATTPISTGSADMPTTHTAATPARGHGALAILSAAQFLVALDYSIIYIALPSIARDLRLDPAAAQWVVSAYAVLFAGFLLVGGRLADRVGARPLFIVAILLFGAASGLGGAAQAEPVLLAARGAQGFGAALLQPAVLSLIGTTFAAGPQRSRALAVWGSVGAAGLAVGVILGGLLTSASWRLTETSPPGRRGSTRAVRRASVALASSPHRYRLRAARLE
jgi:MFS family permease